MIDSTAPDFESIALITIDTQRDTLDGQPFEIPGTSAILPRMQRLLRQFRRRRKPIVHIVRLYHPDGSNAELCRRDGAMRGSALPFVPGSWGSELAEELLPRPGLRLDTELLLSGGIQEMGPGEVAIYKPRWGAFYQTPLESHLRRLAVSTIAFTGCNYPNCPRASIYEASERDYRIVLVEDAVSNLDDRGRVEMRNIGVALLKTEALEECVDVASAPPSAQVAGDRDGEPREG